ncbi:MAG: hypothetical protein WCW68_08920 [Methanothrix sp.]
MRILLDPKESQQWLDARGREKILEETSRLPDGYKCSPKERQDIEDAKVKITNWPSQHKEEIMGMVAEGKFPREIARELEMKESSVKHLVYHEKKKARQKELGNYPSPETDAWIKEAAGKLVDKGSMKPVAIPMERAESPAKEPTTGQDRIDAIIQMGSSIGLKYITIAAQINNDMGGQWLPDDVSKRLAELRGEGQ